MSAIIESRRSFVAGLGALFIAAPAIVRASSIMPVKALQLEGWPLYEVAPFEWGSLDFTIAIDLSREAYEKICRDLNSISGIVFDDA